MKSHRQRRFATAAVTVTVTASAFGVTLFASSAEAGTAAAPKVTRVSLGINGKQANAYSLLGAVTPNGRYVLFLSSATNLVKGDSNGNQELYRRDTVTGKTEKVTWSAQHGEASTSMISNYNGISANGRYVVFDSSASNLVRGDTNNVSDVFLRDMKTGVTKRISVKGGKGDGAQPSISANGRLVAFASGSTAFVPKDTNKTDDIFVKDLKTNKFTRVSVTSKGGQSDDAVPPSNTGGPATNFDDRYSAAPLISGDGTTVAFMSYARNLVPKDTNNASDVFLHSLRSGKTTRVSVKTDGSQANNSHRGYGSTPMSISADGTVIVMIGDQADLAGPNDQRHEDDTYVRNLRTHVTSRVTARADGVPTLQAAGEAYVSPDGRYLAFASTEPNVKLGYTGTVRDIFIRDLKTNKVKVVPVTGTTKVPNDGSWHFVLTTKAAAVVFQSYASNLVGGDTNGVEDIFKRTF